MKIMTFTLAAALGVVGCGVWHGEVSREEAIAKGFEVCRHQNWPCREFEVENRITQWVVFSTAMQGAKRAYIHIDKSSGEVTSKVWAVHDIDKTVVPD